MTILSLRRFSGEIPRLPPERLPEGHAREAVNCDFSHGELRSLKGQGMFYRTSRAVRSLFTDDGLAFFTWDKPTRAFLSPTIDDMLGRVYFANETGLWVTQKAYMKAASRNPGPPEKSWRVGVKAPAVAPEAEVLVSPSWRGDAEATVKIEAVCKAEGGAVLKTLPIEAEAVETVSKWTEYLVRLAESPCGNEEAKAELKGGWAKLEEGFIGYIIKGAVSKEHEGGLTNEAMREFGKGALINAKGQLGQETKKGIIALSWGQPDVIFYKGAAWYPTSTLYTALVDGTVENRAKEILGTKGTLAFRFTVHNEKKETVYYQTDPAFTLQEDGRYRLKISYDDKGLTETIAYVTTFQNEWGEESRASPAVLVDVNPIQDVVIRQPHTPDPAEVPLAGMNVYRTYGKAANFILATAVPVRPDEKGRWQWQDSMSGMTTITGLTTQEWDAPPEKVESLTYVGNGFFAVSSGKDLWFSEPYRPHAWPYAMTFPYAIMGVIAVEGGLLVTTKAQPYLVQGPDPEQMGQQILNAEQAGVGGRAMAQAEGRAIYASHDGLVAVAGGSATLDASQYLFSREDWRAAWKTYFSNLTLNVHDGQVLGVVDPFYPLPSPYSQQGFVIRLDETAPSYSRLSLPERSLGMNVSATTDTLYLGFQRGFAEFATGNPLLTIWRSQDFVYPEPVVFAAAIVRGEGEWQIEVFAENALIHTLTVQLEAGVKEEAPFRLPAAGRAKCWSVRFTGTGVIRAFEMGASFTELRHG